MYIYVYPKLNFWKSEIFPYITSFWTQIIFYLKHVLKNVIEFILHVKNFKNLIKRLS